MRPLRSSDQQFPSRRIEWQPCLTGVMFHSALKFCLCVVVGWLCCGCQGTGPAKYDNPVVGPPPPRLPPEQIQRRKLAAAEMRRNRDIQLAAKSDGDGFGTGSRTGLRPSNSLAGRRTLSSAGQNPDEEAEVGPAIQQVSLSNDPNVPVTKFEDGTIVATVNGTPIFAGEVLAPAVGALANKEQELRKAMGPEFKPEMMDRVRAIIIAQSLPRIIERKMLVHAAKSSFKKQQLDGLSKAIDSQWTEHLQQMMQENEVGSVSELEQLFIKSKFNLEEHKAAFVDQRTAAMYVSSKVHSKYKPSRTEMLAYYEEHREDYKTPAKVRWQQLAVSFEKHKSRENAKRHIEVAVQELLKGADFTATIKKYGDGPKAEKGGTWDWTEKGTLQAKEVENEIFTLPIGDMSGVIETAVSFQIVQVLERTEDSYTPYEQLQEKIKERMENAAYSEKATALLKEIRARAIVETCFDEETNRQKAAQEK